MKRITSLTLVLIILISVSGCHRNSPEEVKLPDGFDRGYAFPISYLDEYDSGIYKMASCENVTYIAKLSVYANHSTIGALHNDANYQLDFMGANEQMIYTINRHQDQMIIIDYENVSYAPIVESGYTIEYLLDLDDFPAVKRSTGAFFGGTAEEFEAINGKSPAEFKNRMSPHWGGIIRSSYMEEFTFSYYSGTDYVEEKITADSYYYIVDESNGYATLPIEKTTDGYFIVDYSSLAPGIYCFNYSGKQTLIEIV